MHNGLQSEFDQLQQRFLKLQAEHEALKGRGSHDQNQNQIFFQMAERATAGLSFFDFLQSLHGLLGELMYAKNCYVCLYDDKKQVLNFPYYIDEKDGDVMQADDVPYRRGLTEFVLRTARAQLIDRERFLQLQTTGDVTEATGDLSFMTWLGVPMHIGGAVAGVLVVQSYESGVQYTAEDAQTLSFVANHFSSAIERYRAIEALSRSEERYRTVIENVGVGVVVVQAGRMVFANPSMVRIVGHSMEYLLSQPFTATIHPDDVPAVVDRHQRRLRGEPVDMYYGFRVITQAGEVRPLELSAVKIEWDGADATLLFVVDASARLQAELSQRLAVQKQTELNDMKARFIAMASHEFRTPLTAIHGSVDLLRHYENRMSPDKKHQTLEKIDDAVERMTHMLENVLLIGRTDAGQMEFRPKPLALHGFCMGLLDELKSAMGPLFGKVQLQLQLCPPEKLYLLDAALMRNVVGNLLSNAIKYSPLGGSVALSIVERGGDLVMTFSDDGIGIPEQDLTRLFQSFHRASNVGSIAGTGLGLSIVKQAVECHKGSITVQSTVGTGSVFTVILPNLPTA
jgi:PAS domain S-box-containing protein